MGRVVVTGFAGAVGGLVLCGVAAHAFTMGETAAALGTHGTLSKSSAISGAAVRARVKSGLERSRRPLPGFGTGGSRGAHGSVAWTRGAHGGVAWMRGAQRSGGGTHRGWAKGGQGHGASGWVRGDARSH